MGWGEPHRPRAWVLSERALRELLHRAHEGEDPDLLLTEAYANGRQEKLR